MVLGQYFHGLFKIYLDYLGISSLPGSRQRDVDSSSTTKCYFYFGKLQTRRAITVTSKTSLYPRPAGIYPSNPGRQRRRDLVGDFNEELNAPQSRMGELAARCGLADVFAVRLGSPKTPATYQRGTKRFGYILVTPSLLPHIRAAGYDLFGYRISSDHRGMYLDFATEALFSSTKFLLSLPPPVGGSRRKLPENVHGGGQDWHLLVYL